MKIYLRDNKKLMYDSWIKYFSAETDSDVEISHGDIFLMAPKADAIVSPANSFGFMDGGIDFIYSSYFGWDLENRLQNILSTNYCGELPVGQAVILPTNNDNYPYLVSAPTMRIPMDVSKTVNAYLAFRAVFLEVKKFNAENGNKIKSILCPGLATAVGQMQFDVAAKQMYLAYRLAYKGDVIRVPDLGTACNMHNQLIKV